MRARWLAAAAGGLRRCAVLCVACVVLRFHAARAQEDVWEEATVRPLTNNHVEMTVSVHTTKHRLAPQAHHALFPGVVSELLDEWQVQSLSVSLSRGRFEGEWEDGAASTPSRTPGGTIRAAFSLPPRHADQEERLWQGLTKAVGGLLCASLAHASFEHSVLLPPNADGVREREARMATETVCTENLSPWRQLTPCGANSGVVAMLDAISLFETPYHVISLQASRHCHNALCTQSTKEVHQTVVFVKRLAHPTLSLPLNSAPLVACPLASSSLLRVVASDAFALQVGHTPEHVRVSASCEGTCQSETQTATESEWRVDLTRVTNADKLSVVVGWPARVQRKEPVALRVTRYHTSLSSSGTPHGDMHTVLTNSLAVPMEVWWEEALPWFVRPRLHTLQVATSPIVQSDGTTEATVLEWTRHTPPSYQAMSVLSTRAVLPPSSTSHFLYKFDKAFVKWTEHPPDPARGFDLWPARVWFNATVEGAVTEGQLETDALLLLVPIPDFSMPFNALCFVCTVVVIFVESLMALFTRDWKDHLEKEAKRKQQGHPLVRAVRWVVNKCLRRGSPAPAANEEGEKKTQ